MVLVGEEDKVCALSARVTAAVIPAGQVVGDISEERQIGADVVGVFLDANYVEGRYFCWYILVERSVSTSFMVKACAASVVRLSSAALVSYVSCSEWQQIFKRSDVMK